MSPNSQHSQAANDKQQLQPRRTDDQGNWSDLSHKSSAEPVSISGQFRRFRADCRVCGGDWLRQNCYKVLFRFTRCLAFLSHSHLFTIRRRCRVWWRRAASALNSTASEFSEWVRPSFPTPSTEIDYLIQVKTSHLTPTFCRMQKVITGNPDVLQSPVIEIFRIGYRLSDLPPAVQS
jgi:hypothetical protein